LILVYADLRNSYIPLLSSLIRGGYNEDFTIGWYKEVGRVIVHAMITNAFFPIIEFGLFFTLRWGARFWSQRLRCSRYVSKAKSIQEYLDLYCGPMYAIHYKYSYILNVVFITFMFGAGLPILFPIALLSMIVLYLVESLCLVFSYRKPPMFDASLNR
jgi:hypothetical protein